MMFKTGIVVLCDKGAAGGREDLSGPKIMELLPKETYEIVSYKVLPDEQPIIEAELIRLADTCGCHVIFTSGGTGLSKRDVTPEATLAVAHRNVPGVAEAIRAESMRYTKRAMLSRGVCVTRGETLIVNLPGSPKAVAECLEFLLDSLEHGLEIMLGQTGECARSEAN
jgi:molybdenum cofactor synthesis domain-containing protein